jgi:hypothetical protein
MRFEGLRETLLRAGVAPRHVRRYLRELDDHLADLIEARQAAGHDGPDAEIRARALLGGDAELAAAMLARPELKSWAARAPWLVFGLIPPVAIVTAFAIVILPLVGIANLDHMALRVAPRWYQLLAQGAALFANFALAPMLALALVWLAGRQRLSRIWPLLGIAILAMGGVHMTARFPTSPQHGTASSGYARAVGEERKPQSARLSQLQMSKALRTEGSIGLTIAPLPVLKREMMPELPLLLAQSFLTLLPALMLLRRGPLFARAEKPN